MSWKNYGDINPIEHGGQFVKHDEEISGRRFYVVHLNPFEDGKWLLLDAYIDLDDDWIEWKSVFETCDTDENESDHILASDVLWYYGNHTGADEEIIESEEEVRERLKQLGIEV